MKESLAQVLEKKPPKDGNSNFEWLSVSKVKTFKDCPAKFRYTYIEKLPRKTWDFHIFGSFLHRVLELFHEYRLEGNDELDHILISKCFKESVKEFPKINMDQIADSKKIVSQYLDKLAIERRDGTAPEVVAVEDSFYIDIDGKVLLNGFIDLVKRDPDGLLHVADYKTSKSKKYLKKDFLQLKTYAYVKCLEDPSIERIRASYIMLRFGFEEIAKEFTRDEVMSMEKYFLEYADSIKAEKLWRPNTGPLCRFCDHLEVCESGQEAIYGKKKDPNQFGAVSW